MCMLRCLIEVGHLLVSGFFQPPCTYETSQIPDLSYSIFIALSKKAGAIECELHKTISLMSHLTKVLLRVILNRTRTKIGPDIVWQGWTSNLRH